MGKIPARESLFVLRQKTAGTSKRRENLKNKIIALLMIAFICLASVPASFAFAAGAGDSGFETFLSVLKAWGTFLAKITGSYDSLENIALFSSIARVWHDIVTSDGFSPERLFEALLRWLGFSIMTEPKVGTQESYSL